MTRLPLSIALFTNTAVRAGVEEHILTLLRGLDRRLFRPSLICPPVLAAELEADVPGDVEVLALDFGSPLQARAAWSLARFLRERKIDILHSHMFQSSVAASPVAWACGVPAIIETAHGREDWRRGWLKSRFVIDRIAGWFVDRYIAVSEGCGAYLVNTKGLPAHKVQVIANGCNLERFSPSSDPGEVRRELGFGPGKRILIVVARLEPQKGHAVLLDAMARVREVFPTVRLVCVGEGSLRSELESKAATLGLADTVRFVGFRQNVERWLGMADVAVLPSFYEGMPLAAIEALGAGRPLVATAVDGTSEVVVHGRTGLLVPPGDAGALAAALLELLRDPAACAALGEAGREWVLQRFSDTAQIRRTQQLYLQVMAKRHRAVGEHLDEDTTETVAI